MIGFFQLVKNKNDFPGFALHYEKVQWDDCFLIRMIEIFTKSIILLSSHCLVLPLLSSYYHLIILLFAGHPTIILVFNLDELSGLSSHCHPSSEEMTIAQIPSFHDHPVQPLRKTIKNRTLAGLLSKSLESP